MVKFFFHYFFLLLSSIYSACNVNKELDWSRSYFNTSLFISIWHSSRDMNYEVCLRRKRDTFSICKCTWWVWFFTIQSQMGFKCRFCMNIEKWKEMHVFYRWKCWNKTELVMLKAKGRNAQLSANRYFFATSWNIYCT